MSKTTKGPSAPARRSIKKYSPELAGKVIDALAGGKTYADFDRMPRFPCTATIYNWRKTRPEFAEAADAARAFGAEFCADRALEVAEQATEETVRKAKLHVDTLMLRAGYLAPGKWSARAAQPVKPEPVEVIFRFRHFENVTGPDGKVVVREIKPEGEA